MGIVTPSTKQRLKELERAKAELSIQIAKEEMKKPALTKAMVVEWLTRLRKLDITKTEHRRRLVDTFINAVFLYYDKIVIGFNYKDGAKTTSLEEVTASPLCSDLTTGTAAFIDKTAKKLYNVRYKTTRTNKLKGRTVMKKAIAVFLATVMLALSYPVVCSARLIGDTNNDSALNSLDAARILKHDVQLIAFESAELEAADINADGEVNSLDAALVLKYDAGLIEGFGSLPIEDSAEGSESGEEFQAETAEDWLDNIVFGINYFNGINEDNDNDAYFRWIREQGFNAVEIGCRYGHLVDGVHGDLNLEYVEKLRNIIDCAYEYGFYIILTLYDGYDYMWTSLNYANRDSIIEMLNTSYKKLVENLNSYDDKLAISFCSEPRDYTDGLIDEEACEVLNAVNKEFVRMVRSTGGNNLYRKLAITTGWSKWDGLAASRFQMVDDEYTFVRIHMYEPNLFAGSKTEEAAWDEVSHQLTLVNCFNSLKKNFIDKGIPVYIGEFGCRPKDND